MLFASILPWAAPLALIYTLVKLKQVGLSVWRLSVLSMFRGNAVGTGGGGIGALAALARDVSMYCRSLIGLQPLQLAFRLPSNLRAEGSANSTGCQLFLLAPRAGSAGSAGRTGVARAKRNWHRGEFANTVNFTTSSKIAYIVRCRLD